MFEIIYYMILNSKNKINNFYNYIGKMNENLVNIWMICIILIYKSN